MKNMTLMKSLTFSKALKLLKIGHRLARRGWNGEQMFIEMQRPDEDSKMTLPYIYIRTAQGDLVPWLCSQTDMLSDDWMLSHEETEFFS